MLRRVAGDAPEPVGDVALHLLTSGGKRVRPRVVLLASGIGDRQGADVVPLAAAAELVHNASLLHDDVIDEAPTRRGRPAAHTIWGNAHSVLAGDHLMACALELLEASEVPGTLRSMLATMRRLVHAEVIQLAHRGSLLPDIERYEQVIRGKTAALFSWCADAGARAAEADQEICRALSEFGEEIGVAFQLFDDLLDLDGSPEELGKSLYTDIAQGVATLPVILAAQHDPSFAERLLPRASSEASLEAIAEEVRAKVQETGALEETRQRAHQQVDRALVTLEPLGQRPQRQLLIALAQSLLDRRS